jgi:phosphate transport system substrate-binding protein
MRNRRSRRATIAAALGLALCVATAHGETLVVVGTGAGVAALDVLGSAWAAEDKTYQFRTVKGLGSEGGVRALIDRRADLSVSGRAISPELQRAHRLRTMTFAATPWGFVTSSTTVTGISRAELTDIVSGKVARWSDGTQLRIVLRPLTDSDTVQFGHHFPELRAALGRLHGRRELPIAGTDHDNFNLAESTSGAFALGTLTQIVTERRRLRLLALDGVAPTVENFAAGRYPLHKDFVIAMHEAPPERATRFLRFLASPAAAKLMAEIGLVPIGEKPAAPRGTESGSATP